VRLRLSAKPADNAFAKFDDIFAARLAEANEFYDRITPKNLTEDERRVHRQALAGMLWFKQFYYFDLDKWLLEHDAHPVLGSGKGRARNGEWFHMLNQDVISMPDKWEYPWYAAWDLGFHTVALSLVDFDFAKDQLLLMLRTLYAHPNGQIPAYEWNFSDVNPPVHAWATLFLYRIEIESRKIPTGRTTSCSTSTSMATMGPDWERATRRVGRELSLVFWICSHGSHRKVPCKAPRSTWLE
jgi:hypothetical protein